jgi:hypothetical protein
VSVRRQHGQEYTWQKSVVTDHREALGIEPDDDLCECLVHPPQLHCISHIAQEFINPLHVDIQGELGGKLGVQQQQGFLQETWGESRWEEIVHGPRQGGGYPVTPLTHRRTHHKQHQCDAQWAG